jgi:hypothetical protein
MFLQWNKIFSLNLICYSYKISINRVCINMYVQYICKNFKIDSCEEQESMIRVRLAYVGDKLDWESSPDGDDGGAGALKHSAPDHHAALHGHVRLKITRGFTRKKNENQERNDDDWVSCSKTARQG